MRSRQYSVHLTNVKKIYAYRVYSDRSVEEGCLENGEFIRSPNPSSRIHTRARVNEMIRMAREFGYDVKREWL